MSKEKNIVTVHATLKGVIKQAVIQKEGKIKAHLISSPELLESDQFDHNFHGSFDPEEFNSFRENYVIEISPGKNALKIKKQ